MLIQLSLKHTFDRWHVQPVPHPTDNDLGGQVGVGDDVTLRLLQANGAVGGAGIGAVGGGNGVVDGRDDAISRVALKVGNGPGKCGGHGGGGHGG